MPARQSPMGEVYNPSRIGNHQTRPTDTANRERWWYRWYRLRSRSRGWRGLRGWSEKRRMLVGSDTTTLSDRAWCDGTDFRFEETAETSFLQRFAGSLSNAWNGSDTILDWTLPGLLHRCCALESRDSWRLQCCCRDGSLSNGFGNQCSQQKGPKRDHHVD